MVLEEGGAPALLKPPEQLSGLLPRARVYAYARARTLSCDVFAVPASTFSQAVCGRFSLYSSSIPHDSKGSIASLSMLRLAERVHCISDALCVLTFAQPGEAEHV